MYQICDVVKKREFPNMINMQDIYPNTNLVYISEMQQLIIVFINLLKIAKKFPKVWIFATVFTTEM